MKCRNCQTKEDLPDRQTVVWDHSTQLLQIYNIQATSTYLLITNLIQTTIADPKQQELSCQQCSTLLLKLSYAIKNDSQNSEFELALFTYCILVLDGTTGAYKKIIQMKQNSLQLAESVLGWQLMGKARKKLTQTNSYSTILSYEKIVQPNCAIANKQPMSEIILRQTIKEDTKQYQAKQRQSHLFSYQNEVKNLAQESFETKNQSQHTEFQQQTLQSSREAQLVDSKEISIKPAQVKSYDLFVTKMQTQIQDLHRSHLLHEYHWQQQEIEFIMQQVSLFFGEYQAVQQKRRYMHFTFKKQTQDRVFKEKWDALGRQILLSKDKVVTGKIVNYYILSKEQILPNKYLTNKLFLLPNTSPIIDLCLADPWVAIATTNYVLFIHAYQPMDYFQHQGKVAPIKLCQHKKNSKLLLVLHKEGILCYKLLSKEVVLQAVCHTFFLEPHSIQFLEGSLLLAGIDYHQKECKRTNCMKRRVYKIEDEFRKTIPYTNTPAKTQLQNQFQIFSIQAQEMNIPITNLVAVPSKEVFACTFLNKFLLFSIYGHRLVEVQLKSTIKRALFLPFVFNLFNFVVATQHTQGVRIGIEFYGGTLGAELQKFKQQNIKDLSLLLATNAEYELLIGSNQSIIQNNYLKDSNVELIREQKGQVIFLRSDSLGIAYLVDLKHSYELKYLEI